MRDCPQLIKLVKNDTGSFICVAGPAVFSLIILGLIILFDYPFEGYSIFDLYILVIGIPVTAIVLWPFVGWWYFLIRKTFKEGVELEASVLDKRAKYAFDLGIHYSFIYEGCEKEHINSLVPNQLAREISGRSTVRVIYHPKKNVSFIKEVYC